MKKRPRPLVLMILDGWGHREAQTGNAVLLARPPTWKHLCETYPLTHLTTSGESVGLPPGTIGNSEVGHLTIGAGRIVMQDLMRINRAIADKSFFQNRILLQAFRDLAASQKALHLIGLCSDVGVHAHLDHLDALLDLAARCAVKQVLIHAITDGRDSSPKAGTGYLERVERKAKAAGNARVATIGGRYFAMDRDRRWDRTQTAWRAIALAEGGRVASAAQAIADSYAAGRTDEFILPAVIPDAQGAIHRLRDGDAVLCFNFRADRMRQIVRALAFEDFGEFPRPAFPRPAAVVCMTEYDATFRLPVAFPTEALTHILGEVIAAANLTQLRIAETEKYAHVTYFLNGGEERLFPGEDRSLIPSPRDVATYDLKPEMSANQLTDELLSRIALQKYDVIICNFANPDMVGHTGNLSAAIAAVQTVDRCVGRIVPAVLDLGGAILLTSDHGNCEEMLTVDGHMHTAHTLNPVPFLYIGHDHRGVRLRDHGMLCDLAPTCLQLLRIPQPPEMTGRSLIDR